MADRVGAAGGPDDVSAPGDAAVLPGPDPRLLPPAGGHPPEEERRYFHPERWDAEAVTRLDPDGRDPVSVGRGRAEGGGQAVLLLSDFHMADGTTGGDDFLEAHLHPDDELGGLYTGYFPPGDSRATLFLSVLTFAFGRVARRAAPDARLDVVLAGDVINFLDLKGRGGTYVSRAHAPFFHGLAAAGARTAVYWLRGNHDYVVPTGPWQGGEFYVNPALRLLAEHGDLWDKENWPPGPTNKGSRAVIELGSAFEVHPGVDEDGQIRYLMSGLDNIRPWDDDAVQGFLDRRAKFSDVSAMAALLARLKYLGAADDTAAYKGAQERRGTAEYRDWLMVQGHTHVPAAAPGVYYNLGTWITTLVAPGGTEQQVEAFPFLLVYLDPAGRRVEEYFVVRRDAPGAPPRAVLQSPEMVNGLRRELGYKDFVP